MYTLLGFTESHLGVLGDIEGFFQIIPGTFESKRPINITGIDKFHLKTGCINGSIVNGIGEPILFNFGLNSPPGCKIFKEPRVKRFQKINKSVLSHITFYLEDNDHKPVDFNKKTMSFICQLNKM